MRSLFKNVDFSLIYEIPISALWLPYIGTTLRMSPTLIRVLRYILNIEAGYNGKPIVFLIHPNELLDEANNINNVHRRSNNIFSYIFYDLIRNRLKMRNLGQKAIPLYKSELMYFVKEKYKFLTLKQYYNITTKHIPKDR